MASPWWPTGRRGASIINWVCNVTLNLIDHKMSLQDAIDAPRISLPSAGSTVSAESGIPFTSVDALQALGYTVNPPEIGSVQGVMIDPQTGQKTGGADSHRESTVISLLRSRNP